MGASPELPNTLVLGGVTYTIDRCEKNQMMDGALMGDIKYSKARIRVQDDLDQEVATQVLFHEVIHGLFDASDTTHILGEEGEEKERLIQSLGKILLRFVQDNDLTRYNKQQAGKPYDENLKKIMK